jgi:D-arabinose 5-phosphate isomerase GutQ
MVEHRHVEHHPIQTSAVLVLRASQCQAVPPPSPPSPPCSPPEPEICEPLDELSLEPSVETERHINQISKADRRLSDAIHVLNTEAAALAYLARLYETDPFSRDGFDKAVESIARQHVQGGKLVIIGVGKSGLIGKKLVSTFNSLAIRSTFLHPTEALHGDLGTLAPCDTLMFITFSGKTLEVLAMIPHLEKSLPIILLTSHTRPEGCEFMRLRPDTILLPAPIHESEAVSFGVSAPTTSTTMALAVGDALAIAASKELHCNVSSLFARNHPGGAIGASLRRPQTVKDLAVQWSEILDIDEVSEGFVGADVLRAGYGSRTGWVKLHNGLASPTRIRRLSTADLTTHPRSVPGLFVPRDEMLSISGDTSLRRAQDLIRNMQVAADEDGEYLCKPDSILAVVEMGDIVGVLEARLLLDWKDS